MQHMPMQNDNEVNTQGSRKMNNIGLPRREGWNTTDVIACGDDNSVDDAAVVIMDLWHEYADRFEAHLIELVEESKGTEMKMMAQCSSENFRIILPDQCCGQGFVWQHRGVS